MNYERTVALHRAFTGCEAAFKESKLDAERLAQVIEARMRDDEAQRDTRMAVLVAQRDDVNQPPTIRRLAAIELEKLESQVIQPSPEEMELFGQLLEEQRQCLRDMAGLQRDFRDALKDLEADLATLRADVLGSNTADLAPRWVDGLEAKFSQLAGGGGNV